MAERYSIVLKEARSRSVGLRGRPSSSVSGAGVRFGSGSGEEAVSRRRSSRM